MLNGGYNGTLDETGRISLPRKMRDNLGSDVVLAISNYKCLQLWAAEKWEEYQAAVRGKFQTDDKGNNFPFFPRESVIKRRMIGYATDIDKQGRISVNSFLRDHAGLSRDCVVIGQDDYIEIWAEDKYKEYLNSTEKEFEAAFAELGERIVNIGGLKNDTGYPHSGIAGANSTLSGAEDQM